MRCLSRTSLRYTSWSFARQCICCKTGQVSLVRNAGLHALYLLAATTSILFASLLGAHSQDFAAASATAGLVPKTHHLSLPLHFEPNVGQTDGSADFLARGSGYTLFLTPSQAVLSLRQVSKQPANRSQHAAQHPFDRTPSAEAVLSTEVVRAPPRGASGWEQ